MPKILVTGASGFVGQHLLKELRDNDIEVVAVGGPRPAKATDSPILALDLNQANQAAQLDFTGITGVVHLAGLAAVGPSFDDPMRYITTNSTIENNLFAAAKEQGASPRFLIVSSASLYASDATLPVDEQAAVRPSSPYAVSKLTQENLAQYYGQRGFEVMIARPFNHIGPGQEPGFIVPDIAQQVVACQRGERMTVMVGNLDAQRDYTDVRDIARAYRLLLEKGLPGEIYNVCSGKALSGHDILTGITQAAGVQPTIEQDPGKMRPADNPIIYGNNAKLRQATGWQPAIDTATTLQDVVADWQQRTDSNKH